MYRLFLLLAVVTVIVTVDQDLVKKQCENLFYLGVRSCCKGDTGSRSAGFEKTLKECMHLPKYPSCERDICVATKRGYGTEDGKMIRDKAIETFEDDFKGNIKLQSAFKEHCLDEIDIYGPKDLCDIRKNRRCVLIQIFDQCREWFNNGSCEGIEEAAKECVSVFLKNN